jgi:hypothetical protein
VKADPLRTTLRVCKGYCGLSLAGAHLGAEIGSLTERIRQYDRKLEVISKEHYPESALLRQVEGIGPLTALTFVLTLEDRYRFERSCSVGAYLVHIQYRYRVRRYSRNHETSHLRPFTFGHRKRALGKRPTLQGRFRHAPGPDHPRQRQGRARPAEARSLGCGSQTARDAIHDFNERGLAALAAKSSRPKRTRDAFDEEFSLSSSVP